MTNAEFKQRQETIKRLTDIAITEIDADDIVDFWGELVGGMITKSYRTGKVKFEDHCDCEVFDSIESAAEAGIYTILEWALDGEEEAVNWLLENGVDIQGEVEENAIESVEPEYTGGGIYVFTGKLANGNFFLADCEYDVRIVNAPIDWEESQYPEWQEAHLVEDLEEADALRFIKSMLEWVEEHKPEGNYAMDDMERIAEDVDGRIKA